ncbi:hypothetical protein SAMN05421788_107301 [Filimonas lacunae]|uniref:DUF4105 domain-containing protein n=1 Tax=Filimonas lacunae TaxID=477680 RepID=A0A173MGT5_9BACT|nr:hypothetical protein [Filimonas lacunae]BAV06641.1 hypothetical protein FLA_2660 [Filimonas lacunae]SIT27717.1 hypothetical protein SAMN05421788_107301 [Filimonas lacunae]
MIFINKWRVLFRWEGYIKEVAFVLLLCCCSTTYAQETDSTLMLPVDSADVFQDSIAFPEFEMPIYTVEDDSTYCNDATERHARRLRFLSPKASYRLAVMLARVKAYAASLKYFSLSRRMQLQATDTAAMAHAGVPVTDSMLQKLIPYLADSIEDSQSDTLLLQNRMAKKGGTRLRSADITAPFRDGEAGIGYGVLLHIKQPVPGNRKSYALFNNVGHMFITLVKFEGDGSHVSRTFGFYPDKENLLSATPLQPLTASMFLNDADHSWDELVARFISRRQFRLILRKIKQYSRERYHLNKNNCTDFGLSVASIAGLKIQETRGSWPLGKGNDPGDTGQSILEGKVLDMSGQGKGSIFMCTIKD